VKKIGHAGTLDPLATGLLILCTGKLTKSITHIQEAPKEYLATFKLGATTATYDAEAAEENAVPTQHITPAMLSSVLEGFRGEVMQVPPIYSAIKIKGKRSFELARRDKAVELQARPITIHELELVSFQSTSQVQLRVQCSKGTYIRSLVHDIGQRLGVGAYLTGLVRTQIGQYSLADALTVNAFIERYPRIPTV
jgi:tRNA pseudouridine55 synthase